MINSNLFKLLVIAALLITMTTTTHLAVAAAASATSSSSPSSSPSLSFSAPQNDTVIVTENDIKTTILDSLSGSRLVDFQIFENGRTVATFKGLSVDGDYAFFKVEFNSTSSTDKQGFHIENGRIFSPDGHELKIVLGE